MLMEDMHCDRLWLYCEPCGLKSQLQRVSPSTGRCMRGVRGKSILIPSFGYVEATPKEPMLQDPELLFLFNHLQVAERLQLFSRSLQLPAFIISKTDRRLQRKTHVDLDAVVHSHYTAMGPYYDRLKDFLPEHARSR